MKRVLYPLLLVVLVLVVFGQPLPAQEQADYKPEVATPTGNLEQATVQQGQIQPDKVERLQNAIKYQRARNIHFFLDQGYTVLFLVLFLFLGLSALLRRQIEKITRKRFWVVAFYTILFLILAFIIGFPSSYYGFSLEHKFDLSNQTFGEWFGEELLGLLVLAIIALIAVEGIYLALKKAPRTWWIYVSVVFIGFTVVLVNLAPILIMPLFNVYTPLPEGELRDRLVDLSHKTNVEVEDIFTVDMSKQTKKANAMFTGLGNTKRIVLGDNLVDEFTTDEIEVVIAHEMGHNLMHHIWQGIAFSSVMAAIGFLIIHLIGPGLIARFRRRLKIDNMADVASLPLILLIFTIFGIITMPIFPAFSRHMERQADRFALDMTHNNKAFVTTMEKLAYMNLSDPNPSPVIEFLLYDHPPISKRIKFAEEYKCNFEPRESETGVELENLMVERSNLVDRAVEYSEYAEQFVSELKKDEQSFVSDERPDLKKVYIEVLLDYAEYAPQPVKEDFDYATIEDCANHFRNYWLVERNEYPKNQDDSIDWFTIYFMVLHHYVNVCVSQK